MRFSRSAAPSVSGARDLQYVAASTLTFLPAGGCYVLAVLNNLSHPLVGRLFDASDRQCNTTPKRGFLSQF